MCVCVCVCVEVGVLRCSSDQGVCDWLSDRDGDLHWETAESPAGNNTFIILIYLAYLIFKDYIQRKFG